VSGETHAVRGDAAELGAFRWLSVHDDLLRGLTHALSNRLGTISATAYMVELQPASTAATLRSESERLDSLLTLFRLLPRRADAMAEPVIPTDILGQAIAIAAHHPEARDMPVQIVPEGDLQPAYAEPGQLAMALCVALGTARRCAGSGGTITVRVSSSTEYVELETRGLGATDAPAGAHDHDSPHDLAAINWLLRAVDGAATLGEAGLVVRVPTLQAARRSQRAASARR
jgi:signal transduction histidine kinase